MDNLTFVQDAANGDYEPKVTDAARHTNGGKDGIQEPGSQANRHSDINVPKRFSNPTSLESSSVP
jgi:hypothetical protein